MPTPASASSSPRTAAGEEATLHALRKASAAVGTRCSVRRCRSPTEHRSEWPGTATIAELTDRAFAEAFLQLWIWEVRGHPARTPRMHRRPLTSYPLMRGCLLLRARTVVHHGGRPRGETWSRHRHRLATPAGLARVERAAGRPCSCAERHDWTGERDRPMATGHKRSQCVARMRPGAL
jgi:hypothetical protein